MKMKKLKTIKHPTIIKSNNLIDAVYKMPINAKHLFSIMLRYITVKTPIQDKNNNIFTKHRHAIHAIQDNGQLHTITAEDYGKLLGIADNQYRELKKATKQLLSTIIKVPLENGDYMEYHIFERAKYAVGDGYTSLAFARPFLPFIQNLKGNYTKLRLAETLRLKKFASVRLYEKMMQYRGDDCSGWYEASLDDLKPLLGVKKGHIYWENKYFNVKVLNPAIKEIIKQLHWKIKVQKIKIGRRIVAVRIEYSDPNYGGLFSQENKQAVLNQAKAKSKALAKASALAHHQKIGIK